MKTKKTQNPEETRGREMMAVMLAMERTDAKIKLAEDALANMRAKQIARARELAMQGVRMTEVEPLKKEIAALNDQLSKFTAGTLTLANVVSSKGSTVEDVIREKLGVKRPGSGPQFDPGALATVRRLPEPFTRESIAVALGISKQAATQRLIRFNNLGWLIQPARGLWKRSATFGVLPPKQ